MLHTVYLQETHWTEQKYHATPLHPEACLSAVHRFSSFSDVGFRLGSDWLHISWLCCARCNWICHLLSLQEASPDSRV